MMNFMFSYLLMIMVVLSSGCTAAIGVGAVAGVSASQERGFGQAVTDSAIHAELLAAWLAHNADWLVTIDTEVTEGRVLLTGSVESPQYHLDILRLTWSVEGVNQVIDEIQVSSSNDLSTFIQDSWITAKLRSRLTFDKKIHSINYTIGTVDRVVYVFGIARNQSERDRTIAHAKNISGVKRVVDHLRVKAPDR